LRRRRHHRAGRFVELVVVAEPQQFVVQFVFQLVLELVVFQLEQ
jgi:hypothetical protein